MANDKPERIANDKKIGLEGQNYYLGTYKLHAPAVFSFTAPNDNYVVKVNGHKVDLINNKFNIKLADKREDASDEQKYTIKILILLNHKMKRIRIKKWIYNYCWRI